MAGVLLNSAHWFVGRPHEGLDAREHAIEGRLAEARAGHATIADLSFGGHITFHLSEAYAVAGETQVALRLLAQAVDRGFYPYDYIAVHCPFLVSLRGTAEFDRVLASAAKRVAASIV